MTDEAESAHELDEPTAGDVGRPKTRRRLWLGLGIVALAVVLVGGALLWLNAARSPSATVRRAAKAAVTGDIAAVEAAIDTTAMINSAVDEMYRDEHLRASVVDRYAARHPGASEEDVKAQLQKSVTERLRQQLTSGVLPKRISLPGGSIAALVAQAYAQHSVKSITIKGNYAYVVVSVPYHGRKFDVVVRMRRSGGDWVADRIENLPEVLKAAGF